MLMLLGHMTAALEVPLDREYYPNTPTIVIVYYKICFLAIAFIQIFYLMMHRIE